MLHLQTGVHFQKIEALVLAGHKFHRAGGIIIHRLGKRDSLLAHFAAGLFIKQR